MGDFYCRFPAFVSPFPHTLGGGKPVPEGLPARCRARGLRGSFCRSSRTVPGVGAVWGSGSLGGSSGSAHARERRDPHSFKGLFAFWWPFPFPNHPNRGRYVGEGGGKGEERKKNEIKRKLKKKKKVKENYTTLCSRPEAGRLSPPPPPRWEHGSLQPSSPGAAVCTSAIEI